MKKCFVITDIHSYYKLMMKALKKAGFDENNTDHIIISGGDLLDRGPDARKCLQFINKMHSQGRAILIRGNHEVLLEELLSGRNCGSHDWHNGTIDTIKQLYTGEGKAGYKVRYHLRETIKYVSLNSTELNTYLNSLQWYYETKNYVFVHGWLPLKIDPDDKYSKIVDIDLKNAPDRVWKRSVWDNGMNCWRYGWRYPSKTVVCGHYHTSWGHSVLHDVGVEFPEDVYTTFEGDKCDHIMHTEPFVDDGIIALDACTALSKKVNVWVIDNFEKEILNA